MPNLEPFKNAVLAVAPELPFDGELYFRHMFGGMLGYFNGRPFTIFLHNQLALKLTAEDREELLQSGGQMLEFGEDMPSRNYVVVPEEIWRDPDKFCGWARRSAEHVLQLPPPKAKKKRIDRR